MKIATQKTLVLAVVACIGIMLIAACEQEQNQLDPKTDIKMSRLMAIKNAELQKQIDRLERQHQKELKDKQELLDKCLKRKNALEKQTQKRIQKQVNSVLKVAVEEAAKLHQENKNLKAQIEKLKAEIEQLKTKPGLHLE